MTRLWLLITTFILVYSTASAQWHLPNNTQSHPNVIPESKLPAISDYDLSKERLPHVVEIDKYELTIWPHYPFKGITNSLMDFTFDGIVTIHFTITQDTRSIWLFAENLLEFKSVDLKYSGDTSLPINYLSVDPNTTRLEVRSSEPFFKGENYTLKIEYRGPINEYGDAGLYRSSYYDDGGDINYLVGTFFEPKRARKMYPSFDDPWFKASFVLTVVYPKQAKIYSNTDKKSDTVYSKNTQYNIAEFLETKRFSSYLLAFTIGDFKEASATSKSGVVVKTVSMPYLAPYLQASANIASYCIDAMENLTSVPYPWGKLDNVEMLEMGHSSAMENVGLIVYTRFLSQLAIATPAPAKLSQSIILCHEISHQWFGDLVTAKRWGYEFLHESFAAFFQHRANQQIYANDTKQVEFIENLMVSNKDAALYSQQNGAHAVVAEQAYFDDITYASGGAMLRMFERLFGTKDFFAALNNYLTKYQYGNADDNDLITEFENVKNNQPLCGKLQLRTVMADFLKKPRYPNVGVYFNNGYYTFNQQSSNDSLGGIWSIPIFALNLNTGEESLGYLLPDGTTCPSNWLSASDPYVFNSKSTTFARFRYDQNVWENILKTNLSKIDDSTLLGLVTDAIQWETEQYYPIYYWQSPKLFRRIVEDKGGDIAPHIVEALLSKFLAIRTYFAKEDAQDLYKLTLTRGLLPVYNTLNWGASDWKSGHLNGKLLPIAVKYDIGDARKKGRDLFTQFTNDCKNLDKLETCNKIQADSRAAAYCAGVIGNDKNAVEFLHNYWVELIRDGHTYFYFQYELDSVVNGLACITNPVQLDTLLDVAVDNDQTNFIDALAYNSDAGDVIYNYILRSVNKLKLHQPLLENALNSMISTWHTENDLNRLLDMVTRIKNKFTQTGQKYFDNAVNQVLQNNDNAKIVIPQFTRWIWDNEVPIGKPVWPKQLTDVNAKNINYNLYFEPRYPVEGYNNSNPMTDYTFTGLAVITYTSTRATQKITLNSHRQLIHSIDVTASGAPVSVKMDRDYDNGILTLTLGAQIPTNSAVKIIIHYTGLLIFKAETKEQGVSLTSFYNSKTQKDDLILFTELAGGANPRSLIPCFDEPQYKATWDVSVLHPTIFTALSNGAILSKEPSTQSIGYTLTTFKQTKVMSSYLIAIGIGNFAALTGITKEGTPVKVWTMSGFETYCQVALKAAIDTIDFLSDKMNEKYTDFNSKLDILAVPDHAGAMENWGLIISKIDYALFDPTIHKLEDKQQVYAVISHETIHHWFGDLVTTKDWANTFVSEGFATFFEPVIWDNFETFGEKLRFIASEDALRYDEKNTKAKIIPDKVVEGYQPFSPIVYAKPASVLHTLVIVVGIPNFRKALQNYIKELKFKNADNKDLWGYFSRVAQADGVTDWNGNPINVTRFMDPFFKQASYPILTVDKKKDGYIRVRQSPYNDPSTLDPSRYNYQWYLPITWRYDVNANYTQWVTNGETSNNLPLANAAYINYRRDTYARMKYSDEVWAEILKGLNRPRFYNETFRAATITDTYSLVNAGQLPYERLLDLLKILRNDNNEIVWRYGAEALEDLIGRLKMTDAFDNLKSFITDLVADRGSRAEIDGWNYLNANIPIARLASRLLIGNFTTLASNFMDTYGKRCLNSTYGVDECIGKILPPESRGPYLCAGIQLADSVTKMRFSLVVDVVVDYSLNDLFLRAKADPYIEAAACEQNEVTIQRYLTNIYDGLYYSFAGTFLQRISQADLSGVMIYNWLIEKPFRVERIQQSYAFEPFVNAMVRDWATQEMLDQFNSIQWEAPTTEQQAIIDRAAKKIQSNIDWQTKNYDVVANWLSNNY